ncbi:PREDICTED: charged multivesicular body protein 2a [Sturnus vulgaris]|uniref:charged multivesicular body protein 2a n=1 Tax=Sturnus vulgaris TaxID=9172 RepID=UPI00071A1303|nr:PREDICTED: charged multivesicular body protein 2a [Sturnus vulgaris]
MELLFGRRRTPEELLRQNQRALGRAVRELDRERQKLEAQEKKIIVDIKKMAKQGQMVRGDTLGTQGTLWGDGTQDKGGGTRREQGDRQGSGDKGHGEVWGTQSPQLKLPQIQRILLEFQKQSELMDMKEELMNDAIDDALGDEDDEDESDAVVSQFIPVLPMSLCPLAALPPPGGSLAAGEGRGGAEAASAALADADADLEERLKNLRRD